MGNVPPAGSGGLGEDLFVIPPPKMLVSFGMGGSFPSFGVGCVEGPGVVGREALV